MTDSTLDPPEAEALVSSEPTLHIKLPTPAAGPFKLSTATKVSLLQDRIKSGPSNISHLLVGMASPVLTPLSFVMRQEEVTPLSHPLNTWRPIWIQLSEKL